MLEKADRENRRLIVILIAASLTMGMMFSPTVGIAVALLSGSAGMLLALLIMGCKEP